MARVLAGRYELIAPIGRGGFGEVWRGRDLVTREPVAVKLVGLGGAGDETVDAGLLAETVSRFRREAATLSGLGHPNIVAARDAGRVGDELYLVLDLVDGASLADVLERRKAAGHGDLPVSSALRIAQQVCAGLAAAHAAGVVHRDIKPGNLMLGPRLRVTVIDFGLARLLDDGAPRLTRPGTAVGTLAYAAPEQLANVFRGGHDTTDGRTDLYSLGCVLYELLGGRQPFTARLPEDLLRAQLNGKAVPLAELKPDLPGPVLALVADLMAKEPAARPPSAVAAGERIAAVLAELERAALATESGRVTVWPGAALTVNALSANESSANASGAGPAAGLPPEWLDELDGAVPDLAVADGADGAGRVRARPRRDDEPGATQTINAAGWQPGADPQTVGREPQRADPEQGSVPGGKNRKPARGLAGRPRRRPRWRGVVSTLVTVAIVGGVAAYVWNKHQALAVSGVSVAVANPPSTRCDVTVALVGTIVTNGKGGKVTYQWFKDATALPAQTVTAGTGQNTVRVTLDWRFDGPATEQETAQLQVLSPDPGTASTSFSYACMPRRP
jgi:hypothetical protein